MDYSSWGERELIAELVRRDNENKVKAEITESIQQLIGKESND